MDSSLLDGALNQPVRVTFSWITFQDHAGQVGLQSIF
jgi:hypothetical protein